MHCYKKRFFLEFQIWVSRNLKLGVIQQGLYTANCRRSLYDNNLPILLWLKTDSRKLLVLVVLSFKIEFWSTFRFSVKIFTENISAALPSVFVSRKNGKQILGRIIISGFYLLKTFSSICKERVLQVFLNPEVLEGVKNQAPQSDQIVRIL